MQEKDTWAPADKWICPSCTFFFYSGPQGIGWHPPTLGGWPSLLSLPIQVLISSGDILANTPRNNVFASYLGIPQTKQVYIKLTITILLLLLFFLEESIACGPMWLLWPLFSIPICSTGMSAWVDLVSLPASESDWLKNGHEIQAGPIRTLSEVFC